MQDLEGFLMKKLLPLCTRYKNENSDTVFVIYGPTATGKTSLSLTLADFLHAEIISADSRQIYTGMDIGTDKIDANSRQKVPHWGIDIIPPDQLYTAWQRQKDAKQWIEDIQSRGHTAMIVGGTGLYIDTIYRNMSMPPDVPPQRERRYELEALEQQQPWYCRSLLSSVDPDTAAELHPHATRFIIRALEIYEQTGIPKSQLVHENPVDHPLVMISLTRSVEKANTLIAQRVGEMIDRGLIDEVQGLLVQGYDRSLASMQWIGYKQTIQRLEKRKGERAKEWNVNLIEKGKLSDLKESIILASVQYAKRQRTWFRRYERDAQHAPRENVYYMSVDMDSLDIVERGWK